MLVSGAGRPVKSPDFFSLAVPSLQQAPTKSGVELHGKTGAPGVLEVRSELRCGHWPPIWVHKGRRRGVTCQPPLLQDRQVTLRERFSLAVQKDNGQVADPYVQDSVLRPAHFKQGPQQTLLPEEKCLGAERCT